MNGVTQLLRIDMPGGPVFLSNGGVTTWAGNTYTSSDSVLGGIAQFSEITEGMGPELPELEIVFAVPSNAALGPLRDAAFQGAKVRLWLAEFNPETGDVVGDPDLRFIGRMDRVRQDFSFRQLLVTVSCVPETEAVFRSDEGTGLSSATHKSFYPGETGHDQATGLIIPVAWGVNSGRGGIVSGGGGGGGGFVGETQFEVRR